MHVNIRDQTERAVSIYCALVQIYLEYCVQFDISQNKKGHQALRKHPKEGHENGQGSGGKAL